MKGAGVNFDEVHTSKLNRAIETAQLAQKACLLNGFRFKNIGA